MIDSTANIGSVQKISNLVHRLGTSLQRLIHVFFKDQLSISGRSC